MDAISPKKKATIAISLEDFHKLHRYLLLIAAGKRLNRAERLAAMMLFQRMDELNPGGLSKQSARTDGLCHGR
jgi:hypothetical protein